MNQIRVFAGKLANDLHDIISSLGKLIKSYAEGLAQDFLINTGNWIKQQLQWLWQQLVSAYNNLVSWISNFDIGNISFDSFYNSVQQIAFNAKDSIMNFFSNLDGESLTQLIVTSLKALVNFISVMFGFGPVFQ